MGQKIEKVSGSKLNPNGNCQLKTLEKDPDCTNQYAVDLGEIEKEQSENLDVEYHVAEDPLNVNGMHTKSNIKPFKCSSCDNKFTAKQSLNHHIVSVHEGKKPFKCSICDYRCSQNGDLKKAH